MKTLSGVSKNFIKFLIILGLFFCYSPKTEAVLKNPFEPQTPQKPSEVKQLVPPKGASKSGEGGADQSADSSKRIERDIPLPKLTVTGIIWNSKRPQAIINNTVVDIGDEIEGVKIIGIKKTAIDVSYQGRERTIEP